MRRFLARWCKRIALFGLLLMAACVIAFAVCWSLFPFPEDRLDQWQRSPVVTDRDGGVMLEITGPDGQWQRGVALQDISPFLRDATIAVEDARFYSHGGVDTLAVGRAAWQNLTHGGVVSGASTLTMQVCRMMEDRPRTLSAKAVESFRALQLEQLRTKDEILELYLNIAPYGGNLRGVESASLAYFGKPASRLSLGEAALLAGLPQSPERLRPDRFPERAVQRRAVVLERMFAADMITADQRDSANREPITLRPAGHSDPHALHAAWMALGERPGGGRTTIDPRLQRLASERVAEHAKHLPVGSDIAVVIIDIPTGELLAVVGSADITDPIDGQVNGAAALRSPGSALKPFIYAAAMDANRINRQTLISDRPIRRGGWEPGNFDRLFHGEVTAGDALKRSLNVPAILVAEGVGLDRCVGVLRAAGVTLPEHTAERGGLSLAVGGIEVSLLELTNAYATLGRGGVYRSVKLFTDQQTKERVALKPETAASLNDLLGNHQRQANAGAFQAQPIDDDAAWFMWKTGTSAARRDALAVGHNRRFAVGVWVGRFAGGGDFAYTGQASAEPLMAELLSHPLLAQSAPPPDAPLIAVHQPLNLNASQPDAMHITAPAQGARFVAWDGGRVALNARVQGQPVAWFLNGELIATATAPRLELAPGRYELTCVGHDREQDVVRFEVTAGP